MPYIFQSVVWAFSCPFRLYKKHVSELFNLASVLVGEISVSEFLCIVSSAYSVTWSCLTGECDVFFFYFVFLIIGISVLGNLKFLLLVLLLQVVMVITQYCTALFNLLYFLYQVVVGLECSFSSHYFVEGFFLMLGYILYLIVPHRRSHFYCSILSCEVWLSRNFCSYLLTLPYYSELIFAIPKVC